MVEKRKNLNLVISMRIYCQYNKLYTNRTISVFYILEAYSIITGDSADFEITISI